MMKEERHTILIVDDEEAARYGMRRALAELGCDIVEADSVATARVQIKRVHPSILLLDINLPNENGLDYLRELSREADAPPVVMITAHGTERTAVEAIKAGAHDYLAKPFDISELRLVVGNALETVKLRDENRRLKEQLVDKNEQTGVLLGASAATERIRGLIEKIAETEATVLIRGESGTGKELVAQEIHRLSKTRRAGAFVAVNCAALPSELIESELFGHEKGAFTGAHQRRTGRFEQAQKGTLFLDEIGDMQQSVQAKLLRALEERQIERLGGSAPVPVDVRIISATHRQLEDEIAKGNFRHDLFYRLNVVTINVPPLRERPEDIPPLATHFAQRAAATYNLPTRRIAPQAMRRLLAQSWNGNVRELRNAIERAVVLAEGDELTERDLELDSSGTESAPDVTHDSLAEQDQSEVGVKTDTVIVPFTADYRQDRRDYERQYIARCLEETDGNVTRAAEMLGIHRQSLQHKLRELGLTRRYVASEVESGDENQSE